MQQRLKRFTLPALIAIVTLFTGVAAASELRSHTHMAFDAPSFVPDAFVRSAARAVTEPSSSTPVPANGASPAIHAAATFTVEVRANNTFFPASVTIAPGDTVVWLRIGGSHNVTADDGSFRLGETASGNVGGSWTTVSHTFNAAGTFRYFCEAHGGAGGLGMSGTVIVQDAAATQTPMATATTAPSLPTATATATLSPTAAGTVVAPGQSKVYIPVAARS